VTRINGSISTSLSQVGAFPGRIEGCFLLSAHPSYHTKYVDYELTKRCASDSIEKLAAALSNAQVDLNPHQVEAALFAFRSPFSRGAILADEVRLEKTITARLRISPKWAIRISRETSQAGQMTPLDALSRQSAACIGGTSDVLLVNFYRRPVCFRSRFWSQEPLSSPFLHDHRKRADVHTSPLLFLMPKVLSGPRVCADAQPMVQRGRVRIAIPAFYRETRSARNLLSRLQCAVRLARHPRSSA
jgi:hypothetical protein